MKIEVAKLDIYNEMDIVLSHRRAMQIAKFAGISLSEQTRFATAVSEICRNVLEYAGDGAIVFNVIQNGRQSAEAVITDNGSGITSLNKILERDPLQYKGRGLGIIYARRLCDQFNIATSAKGTTVTLQKNFPAREHAISKIVVEGWKKHLQTEPMLSAYEELKIRNLQLLELTDELKEQKNTLDNQYREIAELNRRLQLANGNMKDFTYAVSHDLRTPLTSLSLAFAMINPDNVPEEMKTHFNIANRATKRLDTTIKALMDILEIQNPARHIMKEIEMHPLIESIVEDFPLLQDTKDAVFEIVLGEKTSVFYVEAFARSIITNLISNSIKYRREELLRLRIETAYLPNGLRIVYTDNGKGIDLEKNLERLFSPFTRFTKDADGKGIGLYLVKAMLENNGGSIKVDSVVGEGTTFVLDLMDYDKA